MNLPKIISVGKISINNMTQVVHCIPFKLIKFFIDNITKKVKPIIPKYTYILSKADKYPSVSLSTNNPFPHTRSSLKVDE